MGLGLLNAPKLHDQIEEELIDLVVSGAFRPGDRLPAERELAQRYGVGRGSVRKAVVALERDGILDVRVSSGIYIAERGLRQAYRRPAPRTGDMPPLSVVQALRSVEGETAALAAGHADRAKIAQIGEICAEFDANERRYDLRHAADRKIHSAIAAACGNTPLSVLVHELWEMQRGRLYIQIEDYYASGALDEQSVQDHSMVLRAIEQGDPIQARKAMHQHFDRLYFNLSIAPSLPLLPAEGNLHGGRLSSLSALNVPGRKRDQF